MNKPSKLFASLLLSLCVIMLIGLQMKMFGWILFVLGLISLHFCSKEFRKNLWLIYFSVGVLGLTPISTDLSFLHMIQMGIPLVLVILVPYLISRFVYKDYLVRFPWHHGRNWYRSEILYIVITALLAYLILPVMMINTGSYVNWTVLPGFWNLTIAYIGLNVVGLWDELFFVSTVLGVLRRHFTFWVANLTQSVIFTSFLFTLGFKGWSVIVIFIFALIQGYIFKKTESLLYVVTIHLTFDLILHFAIVYAHHPSWAPFFLTR